MGRRWSDKEKALAKHLVIDRRKTCAEVAERFGRSPRAVYGLLYREEDATVASGRLPAGATGETAQPSQNGKAHHALGRLVRLFKRRPRGK
jgi:transposase-like protein